MYEHILDEAERLLEQDEDVIVPVKKIWVQVRQIAEDNDWQMPSFTEFTSLLMEDDRFEFISEGESTDVGEDLTEEGLDEEELEAEHIGFYAGHRVKLARIQLTPDRLGGIIRRKVDDTMGALLKAWEARPEGDAATEDKLLEALTETQKLQREVADTFSKEKMKSLTDALKRKQKKQTGKAAKRPIKKRDVRKKKASARFRPSSKRKRPTKRR